MGVFSERLQSLRHRIEDAGVPWLQAIAQVRVAGREELHAWLQDVVDHGGEGLMLHHGQALYRSGRSADLLKLKPWDDAEGRVIAHLPGQGELAGKLGALLVEMPADERHGVRQLRLGTGLDALDRESPPPIGSIVSFRHQGLTASGLPRFASYWRMRPPE